MHGAERPLAVPAPHVFFPAAAMNDSSCMNETEYQLLSGLIRKEFGIHLKGDKRLTLHTRISHRLTVLDLNSYSEYCEYLTSDPTGEELYALASHITNNETYFFREVKQMEALSELLPEIKREKVGRNENYLRLLSLASSTGEEVYSLSMILQETGLFLWGWDVSVTGMDIDRTAISTARHAVYSANSLRACNGNAKLIQKYFRIGEGRYILKKMAMNNVGFRHGNLLDAGAYAGLERTDIIFCRNVLIYMTDEAVGRIIANIHSCLSDSGYLFIGVSESLIQRTNLFTPEYRNGVVVYRKRQSPNRENDGREYNGSGTP